MTKQEEKRELLIALCSYLPYDIKVQIKDVLEPQKIHWSYLSNEVGWELPKPYLRPISSMTKEEALKLWDLLYYNYRRDKILEVEVKQDCIVYILDDGVASTEEFPVHYDNLVRNIDTFDWLNNYKFDYRNLISRGLALPAPKDMYR